MKLIVDISEEHYRNVCKRAEYFGKRSIMLAPHEKAIANGTPLPKEHGRLIDADVLCDYFWDNRSKLYTHKDLQIVIDRQPTIIDKHISELKGE